MSLNPEDITPQQTHLSSMYGDPSVNNGSPTNSKINSNKIKVYMIYIYHGFLTTFKTKYKAKGRMN